MSIWQKMKGWFTQPTTRYVMESLPPDRVDQAYDANKLAADKTYVRIWLVEMMLAKSRNWFKDYQPAVHSLVTLKYGGQSPEVVRVAAPSKEKFVGDDAVLKNYELLGLMPFRGGTIEIETALVAVKGGDQLGKAIAAVAGFADLVAPPFAAVLSIAGQVKKGADLLFDEDGEVQLGYRNTLGGAGGANSLVPGYVAVVLADATKLDAAKLSVKGDKLCYGGQPLAGYDHMLLRVESATTRDDLHNFADVVKYRDQAATAFNLGRKEEGLNAYNAALAAASVHPELISADRRTVANAIREDFAPYLESAHGSTPMPDGGLMPWADRVKTMKRITDNAPITNAELQQWLAT